MLTLPRYNKEFSKIQVLSMGLTNTQNNGKVQETLRKIVDLHILARHRETQQLQITKCIIWMCHHIAKV